MSERDAARLSQESSAREAGWREGVEVALAAVNGIDPAFKYVRGAAAGLWLPGSPYDKGVVEGLGLAAKTIRALLPTPPTEAGEPAQQPAAPPSREKARWTLSRR